MVIEQVALIPRRGQERIALKVQHLPIAVGGDAHIADQHVRETPLAMSALPTTHPSKRFLADFHGDRAAAFPLCPLMLQKCAAR
jgi:hypothetical protein